MSEARFDIWDILTHYGWELPHDRGVWQTIKCGVHEDTHGSCRISSDTGWIKCLACGFKADAIGVVQHYEGVGYREAVARCEEITGRSDNRVSRSGRNDRRVSRGKRRDKTDRRYVPPRLRERAPRGTRAV